MVMRSAAAGDHRQNTGNGRRKQQYDADTHSNSHLEMLKPASFLGRVGCLAVPIQQAGDALRYSRG